VDQRSGLDHRVGAAVTFGPRSDSGGIIRARFGYDGRMSEPSSETGSTSGESTSTERETPEVGLIPDEELPEDLQPDKNPLAADPDESDSGSDGPDGSGSDEPKVEGMPDMGQPG
jgi:hypothetical protein